MELWFLTINDCQLKSCCEARLQVWRQLLKGIEERGFLSPFLLIRNAVKIFESTLFGSIHPLIFQFRRTFGGKRWWRMHDVCDGWMWRRSRRGTTFDSGFLHYACLDALQVVQRPAWQEHSFTTSNNASTLRRFSFGASSIKTKLGFSHRRKCSQLELVVQRPQRTWISLLPVLMLGSDYGYY